MTAKKPGWRRICEVTPGAGTSSDSVSSETGPVSRLCALPARSSVDGSDPNATASWIVSRV